MARTLAPFAWEDPASGLISAFKYQARLHYGRVLSELLATRLRSAYQDAPLPDLLLPVPLHWRKLLSRGYNQSLLIARHLERELGIPVAEKLVRRVRNTPAQKGLKAEQRKRNLRQAFVVDPARLAALPSGTRIGLVDDVVTTMSTARALRTALQASSAAPATMSCRQRPHRNRPTVQARMTRIRIWSVCMCCRCGRQAAD